MEVGIKKEAVGSIITLGRERTSKIVSIKLASDNEFHFEKAHLATKDAHRSRSLVSSGADHDKNLDDRVGARTSVCSARFIGY